MRVLVFVGVVFLCNVANAQTWVFHHPTFDFGHKIITLPFKKEINGRKPLFFYPVYSRSSNRLPTTQLQ